MWIKFREKAASTWSITCNSCVELSSCEKKENGSLQEAQINILRPPPPSQAARWYQTPSWKKAEKATSVKASKSWLPKLASEDLCWWSDESHHWQAYYYKARGCETHLELHQEAQSAKAWTWKDHFAWSKIGSPDWRAWCWVLWIQADDSHPKAYCSPMTTLVILLKLHVSKFHFCQI
jgi:hypothetical protein